MLRKKGASKLKRAKRARLGSLGGAAVEASGRARNKCRRRNEQKSCSRCLLVALQALLPATLVDTRSRKTAPSFIACARGLLLGSAATAFFDPSCPSSATIFTVLLTQVTPTVWISIGARLVAARAARAPASGRGLRGWRRSHRLRSRVGCGCLSSCRQGQDHCCWIRSHQGRCQSCASAGR